MIKKEKGITLVSLIITILLMLIIASMVVNMSLNRFEVNNLRKMKNDIELLNDKVSTYYLKYEVLPVLRNANTPIKYLQIDFDTNGKDNETYYIIDLKALEGISLNYGQEGFENYGASDDVYIINEQSHTIYYVKGIEMDGQIYHYMSDEVAGLLDDVPPTKPQINIISGEKNEDGQYISAVEIEVIPGEDNWSGVKETVTKYSFDNGTTWTTLGTSQGREIYIISSGIGTCIIQATTYDNAGNDSTTTLTIEVNLDKKAPLRPDARIYTGALDYSRNKTKITDGVRHDENFNDINYGKYRYQDVCKFKLKAGNDLDSGIDYTEYAISYNNSIIESGTFQNEEHFFETSNDGTYHITLITYDKAGNASEQVTEKFIIKKDTTKPNSPSVEVVSGTKSEKDNKVYITDVKIKITAGDDGEDGSGTRGEKSKYGYGNTVYTIDFISYQSDIENSNGNKNYFYPEYKCLNGTRDSEQTYIEQTFGTEYISGEFIKKDGKYTITAYTYDEVGNISDPTSIEIVIDRRLCKVITAANYGDRITYDSYQINDPDDDKWKIFYNDGNRVYIIYDGYLKNKYIPSLYIDNDIDYGLDGVDEKLKLNWINSTEVGHKEMVGDYGAFWFSSSDIYSTGTENIDSDRARIFKLDNWLTKVKENYYNGKNGNSNSSMVSDLVLGSTKERFGWDVFTYSLNGGRYEIKNDDIAIASPTLELFVASYNEKYGQKITMDYDEFGYSIETQNITKDNLEDKLYFPTIPYDGNWDNNGSKPCINGYYLASPAKSVGNTDIYVVNLEKDATKVISTTEYGATKIWGLRPVICLNPKAKASNNGTKNWGEITRNYELPNE